MQGIEEAELKALMAEGMDYDTACGIAGIKPKQRDRLRDGGSSESIAIDLGDMSESELIEANGSLAIRVVNQALLRGAGGDIDATVLNAAVRAVSMLESKRKNEGAEDVADDILRWVDEQMRSDEENN